MSDQKHGGGSDAGQRPHVPGHDPLGSGMPRQRDVAQARSDPAPENEDRTPPPGEEDSPLGGTEVTEEGLTADTAVERDALKSLDPDDSPA